MRPGRRGGSHGRQRKKFERGDVIRFRGGGTRQIAKRIVKSLGTSGVIGISNGAVQEMNRVLDKTGRNDSYVRDLLAKANSEIEKRAKAGDRYRRYYTRLKGVEPGFEVDWEFKVKRGK